MAYGLLSSGDGYGIVASERTERGGVKSFDGLNWRSFDSLSV